MKKRILGLLLVLCIVTSIMSALPIISIAATYGDLTYELSNGEITITDCNLSATSVHIPSEIAGYPVTTIGDYVFLDCRSLTSVTIPNSVTSIGLC